MAKAKPMQVALPEPHPFQKAFPGLSQGVAFWGAVINAGIATVRVAWPWRRELPLVVLCGLTWYGMGRMLPVWWALGVALVLLAAPLGARPVRAWLFGWLRCGRTARLLRAGLAETRSANPSGRLPRIARVTRTPVGERVHLVARPGQSAELLDARVEELRAATRSPGGPGDSGSEPVAPGAGGRGPPRPALRLSGCGLGRCRRGRVVDVGPGAPRHRRGRQAGPALLCGTVAAGRRRTRLRQVQLAQRGGVARGQVTRRAPGADRPERGPVRAVEGPRDGLRLRRPGRGAGGARAGPCRDPPPSGATEDVAGGGAEGDPRHRQHEWAAAVGARLSTSLRSTHRWSAPRSSGRTSIPLRGMWWPGAGRPGSCR